jgi:hypothetical protein
MNKFQNRTKSCAELGTEPNQIVYYGVQDKTETCENGSTEPNKTLLQDKNRTKPNLIITKRR